MALEHKREIPAHVGGRRADGERAGDIGGPVLVLAAGIDQEQFARRNAPVAPAADAVMHDGAIRPGAGDGGKRNILQKPGVAAKTLQRLDRADLGQLPRGASPSNQARKRVTAAPSRNCAALGASDLGRILHRLHGRDRIAAADDFAAVLGHGPGDGVGAHAGSSLTARLRFAERGKIALEIAVGAHIGELFETRARTSSPSLRGIDIKRRPARLCTMAEASTTGVCGTSLPADIE